MFSESKVLQKCFYDEVTPIWMDRARQALQDGIVCFLFRGWPKIFLQVILSENISF